MILHWRTNVLLLILVFVLSFFVYRSNEKNRNTDVQGTLSSLPVETVNLIKINNKNKITQLEKHDGIWNMTLPIVIKANQFRVGSLLRLLSTNNYNKYDTDDLDLDSYSLENPSLSVFINDERFDFGKVNPINDKRYLLHDAAMYLVDDIFFPLVSSQLGTLVDQHLISSDVAIIKIALPEVTLEKDNRGLWSSDNQISSDGIIETLDNWKNAQAFSVHNYMTRSALDSIEIHFKDSSVVTFLVTDVDPWLIIARPDLGLEYHFDKENISKLLMTEKPDAPDNSNRLLQH